jgi:hypothetical protein
MDRNWLMPAMPYVACVADRLAALPVRVQCVPLLSTRYPVANANVVRLQAGAALADTDADVACAAAVT